MPAIGKICYALKARATCADAIERTVHLRSYWDGQRYASHADTYFTVPAFVRAKGRAVRGFVTMEDGATQFHASKNSKNANLILATPKE